MVQMGSGMSMAERQAANGRMDLLSGQIRILAENYPELRSSQNFGELQRTIADVEEHLQASRRLYNANVTAYNTKIVSFPSSMVADSLGADKRDFFVADDVKTSGRTDEFSITGKIRKGRFPGTSPFLMGKGPCHTEKQGFIPTFFLLY